MSSSGKSGAVKTAVPSGKSAVAANPKPKSGAIKSAAGVAKVAASKEKAPMKAIPEKQDDYRNLVDPKVQEAKKQQYLAAFEKLKNMSMEDMQVELIVCIRAQHYRDALMYSQIIIEKDPSNALVQQFQPLLANLAIQANPPLGNSDDEEGSSSGSDDDDAAENGEEGVGPVEDDDSFSSDDPETAWMWSETWRTDKDDD